ncbi:hypothetical protein SEUCBS139899_005597 [Sporothrix eucalyptigena]|uniref:Cyclase n=1 Tax=Sporothrix eucalyptigena TaxID=1812306 RepID=A0ABP0C373_9PEZI
MPVQDPSSLPWDPRNTVFPAHHEVPFPLPGYPNAPPGAAWVWDNDDHLGRLNLLTPERLAAAAREQIQTGQSVRVDLPLDVPKHPAWQREPFRHNIKVILEEGGIGHDDTYCLNTQSGTQWDGFRHVSYGDTGLFYNGTTAGDITGPTANGNGGIHHWCSKALAGRGVLLDYRAYADSCGIKYDSASSHAISYKDLVASGQHQGIDIRPVSQGGDIRPGDFLFVRSGFTEDYFKRTDEENKLIGERLSPAWAGLLQEDAILGWLYDCYFAAVAGDAPGFEVFPTTQAYKLHEYLLPLWGVPIGEMLDLEGVAELARQHGRWTFFFSTAPANCPGGVGSHVNGMAIF